MKTTMKIFAIVIVAIMMTMTVSTSVLAFNPGSIINDVDNKANAQGGNTQVNELAGKIIGFIRNIAVVAGVIILSIIGVKFMVGSAEEKAEYKISLIPLVVGIIIVMGAAQIVAMIFDFM